MSYNGAGLFSRLYSWATDKANGVKIRADRMDAEMDGFATGLSTAITKDGQTAVTANLPMNSFKFTGLGAGTAAGNSVRYEQVLLNAGVGGWTAEVTVTAAATTDILGAASEKILIDGGSATITSLGTGTNKVRFVRFNGANTLTHHATTLILPGAANITTASGDTAIVVSDGSSNARVIAYQRASGAPIGSYQPLDADLTTIAGLTATTDNFMVAVASAWASRTPAQVLSTLSAVGTTFQPLDSDLTAIAALTTTTAGRSILTYADPNADRIIFWDDSAGSLTGLTPGTGLAITTTTIDVTYQPASNDSVALGASGTGFSDLFLASGGVINFNAGDITVTHSSNLLTIAGGDLAVGGGFTAATLLAEGSAPFMILRESDGPSDEKNFVMESVAGELIWKATNDAFSVSNTFMSVQRTGATVDEIQFDATAFDFNGAANFSGAVTPAANDGAALGASGTAWADLFLASAGVINFNAGNYTITHSAGNLAFNGAITLGTDLAIAEGGTGQSTAAAAFSALKQAATDTATGVVELATNAEVQTGTDTSRAVTAANIKNFMSSSGAVSIADDVAAALMTIPANKAGYLIVSRGLDTHLIQLNFDTVGTYGITTLVITGGVFENGGLGTATNGSGNDTKMTVYLSSGGVVSVSNRQGTTLSFTAVAIYG